MSTTRSRMDALEIEAFLDGQQTGVLSLADDGEGYGIPVSFATDDDRNVYFRLGYGPDSQKRRFVDGTGVATFVSYDHTDDGWTSVLARGGLEVLADTTIDAAIEESVRNLSIPYYHVHEQSAGDTSFEIVRLNVRELSGIVEG